MDLEWFLGPIVFMKIVGILKNLNLGLKII